MIVKKDLNHIFLVNSRQYLHWNCYSCDVKVLIFHNAESCFTVVAKITDNKSFCHQKLENLIICCTEHLALNFSKYSLLLD